MSVDQRLQVDTRNEPDRIVLELHGELDLAGAPLLTEALARAESEQLALVLDLEDLQFVDSAGLRVILAAQERARTAERDFATTPGSPQVQRLFKIAGVSEHLNTVGSPGGALATGQGLAPDA